ncbi:MAG: C_GCAxxG_C_C family protein [Deltaproteobacteria bacterium]|nr:C_GCAxxG_C_C family protein [Deltaproteobacteria bacterium]
MSEDKVEKARKRAMEIFNGKRARANCAESVFRAVYELVDTELPPEVSALLTPLGGGIATRGENCAAMLAGVIALGLVYGRLKPSEDELEEHRGTLWDTYSLFNQLPHRFKEKFGTINCWDLTEPYIYGTKECRHNCEEIIGNTAAMVMELLQEAEKEGLPFRFKKTLLAQAMEKTGKSVEELIAYKRRSEPFPIEKEEDE